MSVARFPVTGRLDWGAGHHAGTVLINRENGDFSVRPRGRRRLYTMPIGIVATMVCEAIVRSELAEKRALKKAKKAGRR
jgi:hypothetical protein